MNHEDAKFVYGNESPAPPERYLVPIEVANPVQIALMKKFMPESVRHLIGGENYLVEEAYTDRIRKKYLQKPNNGLHIFCADPDNAQILEKLKSGTFSDDDFAYIAKYFEEKLGKLFSDNEEEKAFLDQFLHKKEFSEVI